MSAGSVEAIPGKVIRVNLSWPGHWTNIVTTLGMVGNEAAVEPLIRFLEAPGPAGGLSLSEFRARLAVQPALGYILARQANGRALSYLREGLNPESWSRRLSWRSSAQADDVARNAQLTNMAIWGLALSGRPEAGTALEALQATAASDPARFREGTAQLLTEARAAHAVIARVGLRGYYAQRNN